MKKPKSGRKVYKEFKRAENKDKNSRDKDTRKLIETESERDE